MKNIIKVATAKSSEQIYREMTEGPVGPVIINQAWPAILSNMVTEAYNLVDTYFVGQLGTAASGAIGVSFVAMVVIQAVGFYFAQGTGTAMSRYLGAKEDEKANVLASTGLVCTITIGLAIAILGNIFDEQICLIAGATPTILPYARTFISIIFLGAPWMCSALMLNMQIRFEGESLSAMIAMVAGAIINIFLSPALIFGAGFGIAGSALANIICQFISFVLLLYMMQNSGITPFRWKYVRPSKRLFREITQGGVPSFVRQCMSGVAATLLNNAADPYGDAMVAAMAIVNRITSLGNYVQIGIGQGYQPVLGYNLGAKNYKRVRKGYFFSLRVASISVFAIGVVTSIFAPQLINFFRDDPEVVQAGTLTLRMTSFSIVLTGASMITNFLLQTSGHMWSATFIGACRLGLVLGSVVVILSHTMGMLGVQIAQPVSDVITAIITIPFALWCLHNFDEADKQEQAKAQPVTDKR